MELTITRALVEGDPGDLVIPDSCTSPGIWIAYGGVRWPTFDFRKLHAPDSNYIRGKQLLAAVRDQGELTVRFIAQHTTQTGLADLTEEMDLALGQFIYDVTLDIDGRTGTWEAEPVGINWSEPITPGQIGAVVQVGSAAIPINPNSGG